MPKSAVPLTDSQVEEAVAAEKPFKLFDGKGLFLLVAPKKTAVPANAGDSNTTFRAGNSFLRSAPTLKCLFLKHASVVNMRGNCWRNN